MLREMTLAVLLALLCAGAAQARYKVTVEAPEGFAKDLSRVAVAPGVCHEMLNCGEVAEKATLVLQAMQPGFRVVRQSEVRKTLFALGQTHYSPEFREELMKRLELDGLFELDVPHGAKGQAGFTPRGSETKVELRLVKRDGALLMFGTAAGRAGNALSSPENTARVAIKKLLKEAFGR